jgi:drug/metabolite transporter (DMT)-like permease
VLLFLFWSYRLGPVSIGATLLFLYVPFTQIINFAITRKRPAAAQIWSSVLVVTGAALTSDFLNAASAANLHGAPFAILAALCFAAYFVLTALLGQSATPALRCFISSGISTSVIIVVATLVGWPLRPTGIAAGHVVVWFVSLGVIWQIIPLFLIVRFVPRTGSGLGTILTSTELPVAVLSSCLFFGEQLRWSQVLGIILVLTGIALPHLPGWMARGQGGADFAKPAALPE